MRFGHSKLKLS